METYHLLPGSFTFRRAGLDLTLSRTVKVQVVGKSKLGGGQHHTTPHPLG